MVATSVFASKSLQVVDFRCSAGPWDAPFTELHETHCLAYVRRGSFGYRTRGRLHELVAGSLLLGRAGDEYICTHHHHTCGDECLSLHFAPEVADELGPGTAACSGSVPPLAALMVLGELAQAAAIGASALAPDEAAWLLLARHAELVRDESRAAPSVTASHRRRAVEAALFIEDNAHLPIGLDDVAAHIGFSSFHFLRLFSRVVGATPHQYLLRVRLQRAARLLANEELSVTRIAQDVGFADLSNFVRTFARAAGVSPRAFRRATRGERKILQERIATAR